MVPNKFNNGTEFSKMVVRESFLVLEFIKMVLIKNFSFQKWYQIKFLVYKNGSNKKVRILKIAIYFIIF